MSNLLATNFKIEEINTSCENQLLLCCARTNLNLSATEQINTLLQKNIDWKYLIQKALHQKVMPLLYHNLNSTYQELVPKDVLTELQHYFQKNAKHNLYLTMQLLRLLNTFESQGIFAIPIKGAILANSIYGNFALRQFCDLDILVRKEDALKARDILVSVGYESRYKFSRKQEVLRLKSPYCKDNNYFHKDTRVNIDFHWQLLQKYLSFSLEHEQLWERHEFALIAGKKVLNLSPEDNLIFLCVHGSRDRWNTLNLVCDVAELISSHQQINWEWVMQQARILGCTRRTLLGLFLANNLLETNIPEEILQRVQTEAQVKILAIQVRQRLFQQPHEEPNLMERSLFDIRIRERLQDQIHYSFYQSILVMARSNGLLTWWI